MFPWIKDFSDPQDTLRHADTWKLNYKEWFWFHPSAFALIRIGSPVVSFFVFALAILLVVVSGANVIFLVIAVIMALLMGYKSYEEIYQKQYLKGITFYDFYIRDYFVDPHTKLPLDAKDGKEKAR